MRRVIDKFGKPISIGSHIKVLGLRCKKDGTCKLDKNGKLLEFSESATVTGMFVGCYGIHNVVYKGWHTHKSGLCYPGDCEVLS